MTRISLIATVLNEGRSIRRLMESLRAQTRPPDEILIVDGGSRDETLSILREYETLLPLRVLQEPGCNISQGRNIALAAAQGDLIAITDAGVHLSPDWLEQITQPLLDDPALDVSCGFFYAAPASIFEVAMGAAVLPLAHEIDPQTFLPSSRSVALRTAAARRVGGYPEWLDYCEDLIFDLRLKQSGARFAFVPQAAVAFQPRSSLRAFFIQYYRYARGDGKADLWRKRHVIRYLTYLVAAPLLLGLGIGVHPIFLLLLALGVLVYMASGWRRLPAVMQRAPQRSWLVWLQAIVLVPIIRVLGDLAKMIGYPVGWRWRLQQRPPDWRWNSRQAS